MRVGVFTGGGDCPGLNAVIRAIVRRTIGKYGGEVVGFRFGWAGMIDGNSLPLGIDEVSGILPRGGTILGTSRTNPYKIDGAPQKIHQMFKKLGLDGLIAVGGEDTLGVACRLFDEGLPVVGIPKTIDNDIAGTDYTFGFDTAVHIATEAIDRLHTTAESHNRVVVVEVMGRHTGWISFSSRRSHSRSRRSARSSNAVTRGARTSASSWSPKARSSPRTARTTGRRPGWSCPGRAPTRSGT
jgi:6-phosphofructokinase